MGIQCEVLPFVDRFYLGKFQYVKGGAIIELDDFEAKKQVEAGNVRIISEKDAEYLKSKLKSDQVLLLEKEAETTLLKKRIAALEKKKDTENELTLAKAQNAELKKQLDALQEQFEKMKSSEKKKDK